MSEDERDQIEIILLPVDIADADRTVAPGSTVIEAGCGHQCYIAPSSVETMKDPDNDYSTICGRCMDPSKFIEGLALTPGGVQELLDSFPPDVVLEMLQMAKSKALRTAWAEGISKR